MPTYLNSTGVSLSMAVYLATDHYDYIPDTISATALIKPVKQQILAARVPPEQNAVDILQIAKSRIGTSIHDGIEKAWTGGHYKDAMAKLGYPQSVIDRIVVNPGDGELAPDAIPVYMEKRSFKRVGDKVVSGKFDFVAEGRLEDVKSTSTFTYVNQTNTDKYALQGSIYRWLNPGIITQDHMAIQFVFTDFMQAKANADPKYPKRQIEQQLIPLKSIEETDHYVRHKLDMFDRLANAPESDIPKCTDEDLWRKAPVYKYYKDPSKRARSTKNFDNPSEAFARLAKDGNVGVVIEKSGEVVACKYCNAFAVCKQKDEYIADGSLIIN